VATLTVLSSLIVRPAILQNDPNQPQPFVCFILPDSSTISQPFIPVLVAVILPSEISQNFSLSDFFVFAENDFVPTFSLTDQPIFDEKTNSFVWLFVGFYEFPIEQAPEQSPNLIPLTLSAYALFEPNEPSLSPISAYDEFPVLIDLTSFEGEEGRQEGNESAEAESSGHEKSEKSDKGESEKGQFSEEKSSSQSKGALAKEAVRGAIGKDPELAMKVFEQEITARALSNAKKNPKSTAKGNGLVITVGAYPDVLPADGRSTAFIVAKVTDEKGNPLSGREVQFTSDGGQILVRKAKTDGQGIVLSRLCSEKLPKGKKKIVTIKAKTNPEAETTVTLDGSLTPLSTSSSSGSVSVFWWSNPPNQQSMVCSSGGGSASGFAGIAQHVIVPSSPPHFVWHNFTKVTGDGHPSQLGLAINLQPENSSTCSPPVGQDQQRYSFIIYPEPFGWQRFHRSSITIRFNYTVARPYPPPGQSWTEEVVVTVNAQNAVLQLSPNNPPLFVWDPENPPPAEKRTVSFTVNTLQTAQVECTLSIYSTRRANGEGLVKTIVEYKPTNTPVSMTWDGTIDGGMPWMPSFAEKGVYAYDLMVRVQQIVPNLFDPDWKASRNMTIERAVDANGQQIFDAEYYGYDDKGTETIEDDDHLYFIRWYVLKCASAYFDDDGDAANELHVDRDGDRRFDEDWVDGIDNDGDGRIDEDPGGGWDEDPPGDFGGDGNLDDDFDGRVDEDGPNPVNASRGEVILYDPDLEAVKTWDLQSLLCLEHNENDGLVASLEGVRHGVLVPVPVSLMEKAGTYYFVLRVWDNHAHLHKDHQVKPALEMNAEWKTPKLLIAWAPMKEGQNFERNPGNGTTGTAIGFRIFPDLPVPPNKLPPTDNRDDYRKAKVIVQVYDEPRGNRTVYLRLFDPDDPSSPNPDDPNAIVDGNDTKDQTGNIIYRGGDNREDGTRVPPSGVFEANGTVYYQVVTDANGRAEAVVILSRQPGNNFKVAGAFDEGVRNGLHIKEGTQEQALRVWTADNKMVPEGNEPDIIPVARATELLTVWRRLHVEVDSMGEGPFLFADPDDKPNFVGG